MTERYLTEPAAWRRIAEAFCNKEVLNPGWGYPPLGLCEAIRELGGVGLIRGATEARMDRRMYDTFHEDASRFGFWWPEGNTGRLPRVAACLLLALLAEEDV